MLNSLSLTKSQKSAITQKINILLQYAAISVIVSEWAIYPLEAIKNRFRQCLDFTSKNWLSPTKP